MKKIEKIIIDDARRAISGYAFWLMFGAILWLLAPVFSWFVLGIEIDPNFAWIGAVTFAVAGLIGRYIKQPDRFVQNAWRVGAVSLLLFMLVAGMARAGVPRTEFAPQDVPIVDGASVSEAEIVDYALPFIKRFEGVKLSAYRDPIGIPTICSGTTRGVRMGMRLTQGQCNALVLSEATEYWRGVSRAMTDETLISRITVPRGAAWTSFTINIGIHAASHSTAMRRLNAGDVRGSCTAMTWWNKAGGKIWVGLVTRRNEESRLCEIGLENKG